MDFFSLPRLTETAVRQGIRDRHATDCRNTAELLAFINVFEERSYYVADGYSSMYAWCMTELHYSEDVICRRLDAARTARRFPQIFVALAEGRLHLTAVLMLADKLTPENVDELITAATHQSKTQIAVMLAHRFPQPDAVTRIVRMPAPTTMLGLENPNTSDETERVSPAPARVTLAETQPAPLPPPRITPTSPERYRFQFALTQDTYDLFKRAQDLLGARVPARDVDQVFRRALELLVAKLEQKKFAATDKPRPAAKRATSQNPRHIPADVRRIVRTRDDGRCTFVSDHGHRCDSRRVEFAHIVPVARGGKATAANLRLRCRAHNQYAADLAFGAEFMKAKREKIRFRADQLRATAHARARSALEQVSAMVARSETGGTRATP